MVTFIQNYNGGNTLTALKNGDIRSFVSQYNGSGQVDTYTKLLLNRKEEYINAN